MKLEDCGFTQEEILKIRFIANLFNCQKMTIENIKK